MHTDRDFWAQSRRERMRRVLLTAYEVIAEAIKRQDEDDIGATEALLHAHHACSSLALIASECFDTEAYSVHRATK